MVDNSKETSLLVLVSGDLPGAGSSSAAEFVVDLLSRELPELDNDPDEILQLSAGGIRRALALAWKAAIQKELTWDQFSCHFESLFLRKSWSQLWLELQPYLAAVESGKCGENCLKKFTKQQANHPQQLFWDQMPEQLIWHAIITNPTSPIVVEGKLAVICDLLVGASPEVSQTALRLFMEVSLPHSAHRVVAREIERNNLTQPGISKEELLQSWNSFPQGKYPKRLKKVFQKWQKEYESANRKRINSDLLRLAQAYPESAPKGKFPSWKKRKDIAKDRAADPRLVIDIDANLPLPEVQAALTQAVLGSLPLIEQLKA